MGKELIISANAHEKKIAILENGIVTEFYVERSNENQGIVGNIYKGKVMKVLPGMQSAFVDIGLERDAFLYVSDFFAEDDDIEGAILEGQSELEARDRERERNNQRDRQREQHRKAQQDAEAAASRIEAVSGPSGDEDQIEDSDTEGFTAADIEEAQIEAFIAAPTEAEIEQELLEKVTDDEAPDDIVAADEEPIETPLRRPRRRGRRGEAVAEPSEEVEGVEPVEPVEMEAVEAIEEIATDGDAEAVSEPIRRGRRGKGPDPRSSRGGNRKKASSRGDVEEPEAEKVVVGSLLPSLAESQESFERVTDDDVPQPERKRHDRLPDTEEFLIPKAPREIEPPPMVPVGSLSFSADPSLERVVDESHSSETEAMSPISDVLLDVVEGLHHEESAEKTLPVDPDSLLEPMTVDGQQERYDFEDRDASLREPKRSEEFARRGGRRPRPTGGGSGGPGGRRPAGPGGGNGGPDSRPPREEGGDGREGRSGPPTISDLLREGQEIIVQIAKEPIASKGARITSHVALPGRFLVYMPTVDHVGVSRKIPSDEERLRLKRIMQSLKREENAPGGFIVRTAGEGHTEEEIRDDMLYLLRTASEIKKTADKVKSPAVVHRDLDLVQRILRDQLSSDFSAIRVDNEVEYTRIVEFINRVQPKFVRRVKLHTRNTPIFEEFGVQEEIDKALKPRVWLKSGGYIVINQTEALVAIDVNTGKFVGKSNRLEDTIVKTNLDAVREIARQIRLRDLGGIIILDLIDMEERKNRHRVMDALQEELKQDRSPSKVLQFNEFGLVAITRKRVRQSLERTLGAPCPYCTGSGLVKSAQTVCYEILADAKRISSEIDSSADVTLRVSPEVAKALRGPEVEVFHEIEDYLGVPVTIKGDLNVHQEQFDFAVV